MAYGVLLLLIILIIIFIKSYFNRRLVTKKRLAEIKALWGKPNKSYKNFKYIASYLTFYHEKNDISPGTSTDLDIENIFDYIDRTSSKPGQQYLYKQLHCLETDPGYFSSLEEQIEKLCKTPHLREQIQLELSKLNDSDAYYLPELFYKAHKSVFKPIAELYIKLSAFIIILLAIAFSIVPNQFYVILLFILIITNTIVHYSNKTKMFSYTHSLPQLLLLNKVSQWLADNELLTQNDAIKQSLANLSKLKKSLSFINLQNKVANDPTDITYLFTEWIKMFFLVEASVFVSSIKKVNKYLDDIKILFEAVAKIDMAISIQSVRDGLPYYCKPDIFTAESALSVTDLYHPLIENCVSNSISITNSRGVLITGSNMSGKTTFIRAIAVNTLFAQTINTCCAGKYTAPMLNIFTSINMSDDMGGHKSYFQSEALSVLNIIDEAAKVKLVNSLVIIDEIYRGTNTIERIAAAKAVLSHLVENRNFVFVSTHDLELAELLGDEYEVFSFEELIAGGDRLVFDYKIRHGLLKNKNGIAVLKKLGYPDSIIDEAYKISTQLRNKYNL